MSRTKDFNWDKITNHSLEDDDLDWLPGDEEMSEAEVLRLQVQVLRDFMTSLRDELAQRYDRAKYYNEPVMKSELTTWICRLSATIRDLT